MTKEVEQSSASLKVGRSDSSKSKCLCVLGKDTEPHIAANAFISVGLCVRMKRHCLEVVVNYICVHLYRLRVNVD